MRLDSNCSTKLLGIALAALVSAAACAKDKQPEPAKPLAAKSEEPAPAEEEEEEATAAAAPAAQSTAAATALANPDPSGVEIDPARMPVEEDFIDEAASHIGKSANLEAELNRIAAEIKKPATK